MKRPTKADAGAPGLTTPQIKLYVLTLAAYAVTRMTDGGVVWAIANVFGARVMRSVMISLADAGLITRDKPEGERASDAAIVPHTSKAPSELIELLWHTGEDLATHERNYATAQDTHVKSGMKFGNVRGRITAALYVWLDEDTELKPETSIGWRVDYLRAKREMVADATNAGIHDKLRRHFRIVVRDNAAHVAAHMVGLPADQIIAMFAEDDKRQTEPTT